MSNGLLIGLGRVDITPSVGVSLAGYGARTSTSVDTPLYAEVLVCRRDGDSWALISADLLGLAASLVDEIRQRIAAACPLCPESIMCSVVHTHSGPGTMGVREKADGENLSYRDALIDKIADMVITAYEHAEPSRLRYASGTARKLAHNRRIYSEEKQQWVNEWADRAAQHPGFVDHGLMVLAVENPDGALRGLLVNYGCHPVTLGPGSMAVSADYVGYLKQELAQMQDIEHVQFCLAGAANINPLDCINEDSTATQAMGKALAEDVCAVLSQLQAMQSAPLISRQQPWVFQRTRNRPKEKQMNDEVVEMTTEFQLLAVDDLAVIALPGELFSEYNQMLRDLSAWPCTIVASITNAYIGYLPTDQALAEGAYETRMAPADDLEGMIMEHCGRLLSQREQQSLSS